MHHSDKKKPSPSRRGSSAGDAAGSGSKNSTPAPSPQHPTTDNTQTSNAKGILLSMNTIYRSPGTQILVLKTKDIKILHKWQSYRLTGIFNILFIEGFGYNQDDKAMFLDNLFD